MKRIAIFVEGYTGLLFVERLVQEIFGKSGIIIERRQIRGGSTVPKRHIFLDSPAQPSDESYYFLIIDAGSDKEVKTRIRDEHQNLSDLGYEHIIGIRDVRPDYEHKDVDRLRRSLPLYIKTSLTPVTFILSVMELETWFLSEVTHFQRVDPFLTTEVVIQSLGYNPTEIDLEQRQEPAVDLARVYAAARKSYQKGHPDIISVLDFEEIYFDSRNRVADLDRLIHLLESFMQTNEASVVS